MRGESSPGYTDPSHPEVAALLDRTAQERAGGPPTALDLGPAPGERVLRDDRPGEAGTQLRAGHGSRGKGPSLAAAPAESGAEPVILTSSIVRAFGTTVNVPVVGNW